MFWKASGAAAASGMLQGVAKQSLLLNPAAASHSVFLGLHSCSLCKSEPKGVVSQTLCKLSPAHVLLR